MSPKETERKWAGERVNADGLMAYYKLRITYCVLGTASVLVLSAWAHAL